MTQGFSPKSSDIVTATALLSRLPLRAQFERSAEAAWAFPIAGLAVGLIMGAVATICGWLQMPYGLIAGFTLLAGALTTGALHEDGLADCADGFWGGWTRERRLEIMRDSRIGAYGVIALILALLLKFSGYAALAQDGALITSVIAAAILSRAGMPAMMALLPPARGDGLSVKTGVPPRPAAALAGVVALGLGWLLVGFVPVVLAASALTAVTLIWSRIALSKIGGQTGDVLGAAQMIGEIAVLSVFAALA